MGYRIKKLSMNKCVPDLIIGGAFVFYEDKKWYV